MRPPALPAPSVGPSLSRGRGGGPVPDPPSPTSTYRSDDSDLLPFHAVLNEAFNLDPHLSALRPIGTAFSALDPGPGPVAPAPIAPPSQPGGAADADAVVAAAESSHQPPPRSEGGPSALGPAVPGPGPWPPGPPPWGGPALDLLPGPGGVGTSLLEGALHPAPLLPPPFLSAPAPLSSFFPRPSSPLGGPGRPALGGPGFPPPLSFPLPSPSRPLPPPLPSSPPPPFPPSSSSPARALDSGGPLREAPGS